jgi:hypothetical protein
MLRDYLESLSAPDGTRLFGVTARDRGAIGMPDAVLSTLDESVYDELWLFAVDSGEGLDNADREGIPLGVAHFGPVSLVTRERDRPRPRRTTPTSASA